MSNKNKPAPTDLDKLVKVIEAEHGHVVKAMRTTLDHAKRAGEALIQAKTLLAAQGTNFTWWVEHNLPMAHGTATTYMRIAANWDKLATYFGEYSDPKKLPRVNVSTALAYIRSQDENRPRGRTKADPPEAERGVEYTVAKLMEKYAIRADVARMVKLLEEAGADLNKLKDWRALGF